MIIPLLPLGHFLLAALSLAWERGTRGLMFFSLFVDAILVGLMFSAFSQGEKLAIVLGGWGKGMGIELAADHISLAFSLLALLLSGAAVAYLWKERLRPYFFMLLHLLLGSLFALIFAQDLFNIYVIMELLTLVSFLLVGYEKRPYQIWASLKYLVLASMGMGIYLFGVTVIYYHTGTLNLGLVAARLVELHNSPWIFLASSLLVTGVAVKSGIFIFSLWLPAAHASASPAVSALLSGLVIKMGIVVLLRLAPVFSLSLPLLVLGTITGLLGIVYAIFTYSLKRMLAFSTLSQIGYLVLGIGIGSEIGILGALAYALGHGLFKGLLFLAAGVAVDAAGREDIPGLIAMRLRIPVAARMALLLGTLGIVSLPPLAGFCGKSLLSTGAESPIIHAILALISVGTVIAFAKLIPLFRLGRGPSSPWPKTVAFGILGLPILLFLPLTRLFVPVEQWRVSVHALPFLESLLVVAAGLVLYRLLPTRPLQLSQRVFHLEEAILVILSGFFLVLVLSLL